MQSTMASSSLAGYSWVANSRLGGPRSAFVPSPKPLPSRIPAGRLSVKVFTKRHAVVVLAADAAVTATPPSIAPAITLTEKALKHLNKLRADQAKDLCLRVGVRQGGCSGMSYVMDFEERQNLRADDSIIDYEGFTMVCDPKSLLFLFGMQLDYSDALIGGGFSFSNPNATSTCGCGKSFAA